ncbi:hypothetical protein AMTR_s00100p00088100 [Amborella trichopoda]|uniref:Uncharacterized protein n=1 Tax=Amborella trichopoda TaxID=13333 RepID=W1NT42_AMBTC|nr:hypothetical protein AMTR_s00100p00088100 [Amborella trichopoda]
MGSLEVEFGRRRSRDPGQANPEVQAIVVKPNRLRDKLQRKRINEQLYRPKGPKPNTTREKSSHTRVPARYGEGSTFEGQRGRAQGHLRPFPGRKGKKDASTLKEAAAIVRVIPRPLSPFLHGAKVKTGGRKVANKGVKQAHVATRGEAKGEAEWREGEWGVAGEKLRERAGGRHQFLPFNGCEPKL